ncbi:uncharacterized protein LOC115679384 [Syzygium oleosum]|uniref:uncharacterized protein LOC115679384 n=1 Tax=Syzygium oleosum TaxID=219896 RepID=UPI0024BA7B3D|nr:uncharacterized protein LOC115679384 [Syzygium oleosum]
MSSEGTPTNEASQDGRRSTKARPALKFNENHRPLFEAASKGDWKAAEQILNEDCEAITAKIMTFGNESITVLDIAVMAEQDQWVENLIQRLPSEYDNSFFRRAIYNAARGGRIRMIKALVDNEPNKVSYALWIATRFAPMQKEVIRYLARRTTSTPDYDTMRSLIMAGHLDIGLNLARRYPDVAISEDLECDNILGALVRMESYFRSGATLNFWERCIYKCIPLYLVDTSFDYSKDMKTDRVALALKRIKISLWNLATISAPFIKRIGESKLRHKCSFELANLVLKVKKTHIETLELLELLLSSGIVLDAASRGISEIVKSCLIHFPELMWDDNFAKELIKVAVNGRQVELYRLVKAYNGVAKLSDDGLTNRDLMEAVVKWSPGCVPADVSGAAFLMQRELQWFKVLEDTSDPSFKSLKLVETKETRGKTYWEVFVEQHDDLLKEARQWIKETSSSGIVVATLITTVAFTAAFTVPGGNDDSTGIPIFLNKGSFLVFIIADALALFSSVAAIMMFLAILLSPCAIEDFYHSLPRNLTLGLSLVFVSLPYMLVAFSSAITIILSNQLKWISIPITLLMVFPVGLFSILQLPSYIEMVESTYWPRLYHPLKRWK